MNFGNVVYAHPSLDTSHGVSRGIGKGGDASTLEFQWTFFPFVLDGLALDVVRYNVTSGRGHDQQSILDVEIVTSFGKLQCPHRIGLSCIPKFEHVVPSPRYDEVGCRQEPHRFDWLVVRANLLWHVIGRRLSELPHSHGLVGADGEDGAAVGREARVEDGRVILVVHFCSTRFCHSFFVLTWEETERGM